MFVESPDLAPPLPCQDQAYDYFVSHGRYPGHRAAAGYLAAVKDSCHGTGPLDPTTPGSRNWL